MNAAMMAEAQEKMAAAEVVRQRWLAEVEPEANAQLEDEWETAMAEARQAVLDAAAAEESE